MVCRAYDAPVDYIHGREAACPVLHPRGDRTSAQLLLRTCLAARQILVACAWHSHSVNALHVAGNPRGRETDMAVDNQKAVVC